MARIILGITGSIAAYKAADIASQLTKLDHEVTCVLTKEALEFVTPLTLQTLSRRPVISDLFAEKNGWQPGHIHLADSAHLLLIAPAMNGKMWLHPATQTNVNTLKSWGHEFIEPAEGLLACGYEGVGRLAEVADIVARAAAVVKPLTDTTV